MASAANARTPTIQPLSTEQSAQCAGQPRTSVALRAVALGPVEVMRNHPHKRGGALHPPHGITCQEIGLDLPLGHGRLCARALRWGIRIHGQLLSMVGEWLVSRLLVADNNNRSKYRSEALEFKSWRSGMIRIEAPFGWT